MSAFDGSAATRRVAHVGVSFPGPCGVRDYAAGLADALRAERVESTLHWLSRPERGALVVGGEVRRWHRTLARELAEERPDALLLHYSVFPLSYRGIPVFAPSTLASLRRTGVPLVTILHEAAYPWHLSGARGKLWAASHRAVLRGAVRSSSELLVTFDQRALWVRSRRWLPRRKVTVAPVFSNLPAATPGIEPRARRVGMFGYVHEGIAIEPVLDAARLLADRGRDFELVLLGAPGADGEGSRRWLAAAAARGIAAPSFSGRLSPQELADALASCAVLLSADRIGPTSRRTTLAASLAAGRPVLALDGRQTWRELSEHGAARVVQPTGAAVAAALGELLEDQRERERLGLLAARFARERMSPARAAQTVAAAIVDAAPAAQRAAQLRRAAA